MARGERGRERAFAAVALLALGACTERGHSTLPNPLSHGGVAENHVDITESDYAAYLGLPGDTFVQRAQIVQLDGAQICFAMTLRTDDARPQLATLRGWDWMLRASGGYENRAPDLGAEQIVSQVAMQGSREQHVMQTTVTCSNPALPQTCGPSGGGTTIRVPAMIDVITSHGTACFSHAGRITPATQGVTLELRDLANSPHRLAFEWHFGG